MQRLFSTFPSGWPGLGLLLLRAAVGVALIAGARGRLHEAVLERGAPWLLPLLSVVAGAALVVGLLTPVASVVAMVATLASADALFVAVMAVAVALLGPGAFSVDSRLFGRREVVIPRRDGSRW